MSQYLLEKHKVGYFNRQRTFFGSFFVIPQCLAYHIHIPINDYLNMIVTG